MNEQQRQNHNLQMHYRKEEKLRKQITQLEGAVDGVWQLIGLVVFIFFGKWVIDRLLQVEWFAGIKWILIRFIELPFHVFFLVSLCVLLFFIIVTMFGKNSNNTIFALKVVSFLLVAWTLLGLVYGFVWSFGTQGVIASGMEGLRSFSNSILIFSEEREGLSFLNKIMGYFLFSAFFYLFLSILSYYSFSALRRVGFYKLFGDEDFALEKLLLVFFVLISLYILFSVVGLIYILI